MTQKSSTPPRPSTKRKSRGPRGRRPYDAQTRPNSGRPTFTGMAREDRETIMRERDALIETRIALKGKLDSSLRREIAEFMLDKIGSAIPYYENGELQTKLSLAEKRTRAAFAYDNPKDVNVAVLAAKQEFKFQLTQQSL